jgi:heat shock protein HslJ
MRPILKNVLIFLCLSSLLWVSESVAAQENSTPKAVQALNIEDRTWRIGGFGFVSPKQPPSQGSRHKPAEYITFKDGTIEGSPGCGQLRGSYRQNDEHFTTSAAWVDREGLSCNDDEKEQGRRVLNAFTHVQRIQASPPNWHFDTLHLVDDKGKTQIVLWPTQSGADMSELEDTFWHLRLLSGSEADFSNVVIHIWNETIVFSTLSQEFLVPFRYRWSGMDFTPVSQQIPEKQDGKLTQDDRLKALFENTLREIHSYELNAGSLTFFDKGRQPIMVLSDFTKEGIETRTWRIAKYPGNGKQPSDRNGLVESGMAYILFLNGRVTGSPGCGGWWGTYKVSGDRLKVEAALSLFGTCELEQFAQDHLVVNAFKGELRITKQDDRMILRESNGKPRIVLVLY